MNSKRYETCWSCGEHVTVKVKAPTLKLLELETSHIMHHVHFVATSDWGNGEGFVYAGVVCFDCLGLTSECATAMARATRCTPGFPSAKPVNKNYGVYALNKVAPCAYDLLVKWLFDLWGMEILPPPADDAWRL